ncbi:hypothetical protein AgCh_013447 [Apium graveolens]
MVIWLHPDSKPKTVQQVDQMVSVEISDKQQDPLVYDVVSKFMIHGPCGELNKLSPYMDSDHKTCTRHFPKRSMENQTVINAGNVTADPNAQIAGSDGISAGFTPPIIPAVPTGVHTPIVQTHVPSVSHAVPAAPVMPTVPAAHAEKPKKFNEMNFKRWKQKMHFYLTTLHMDRFLKEEPPLLTAESNVQTVGSVMDILRFY